MLTRSSRLPEPSRRRRLSRRIPRPRCCSPVYRPWRWAARRRGMRCRISWEPWRTRASRPSRCACARYDEADMQIFYECLAAHATQCAGSTEADRLRTAAAEIGALCRSLGLAVPVLQVRLHWSHAADDVAIPALGGPARSRGGDATARGVQAVARPGVARRHRPHPRPEQLPAHGRLVRSRPHRRGRSRARRSRRRPLAADPDLLRGHRLGHGHQPLAAIVGHRPARRPAQLRPDRRRLPQCVDKPSPC